MSEETKSDFLTPQSVLEIISRRRWFIIVPVLLSGLVCFYLSLVMTEEYSASTVILVQPQRVPQNYVRSLVTDGVESRINTISQEIQSRANLEKIIQQFSLYPGQGILMEDRVDQLKARIAVDITSKRSSGGTNAFAITYQDSDPQRAADVANALASLFIDENLKIREAQALGTSGFLEEELATMQRRLEETEKALSEYHHAHMGELPSQLESNLRQLDRLQKELADKEEALGAAKARLVALLNPADLPQAVDTAQVIDDRDWGELSYGELQAELSQLQTRYTDRHPDIIRLKQLLENFPVGYGGGDTESQVVIDTRRDILAIEKDLAAIRRQIALVEGRVENIPRREQELLTLERDYRNLRETYQSLLDRKLEAEIALNMERKQKGEQFKILDPAHPPSRPVFPDTMRLFAIALISGLGVGAGISFLLEYSIQVFRRPDEIEKLLGIPLVATIPMLSSRKSQFIKHMNTIMTISASTALCVVYGLFGALVFLGESGLKSIISNYMNTIN